MKLQALIIFSCFILFGRVQAQDDTLKIMYYNILNFPNDNPAKINIGDNVYIAPGVKMYGDIRIANGVALSANSVVNKSFENEHMVVGGIPAKEIKEFDTKVTNILATDLIEAGIDLKLIEGKAAIEANAFLK